MDSCGAVAVGVVEDKVPPPSTDEGPDVAAGERVVVDGVATHLVWTGYGVWIVSDVHPIAPVSAQRLSINLWDFIWRF